jgi:aromatic-L-amino-acid decarboxylase
MWLHVDAAYGGPAMLAEDLRPQFVGIERADSIAFDPHKWLYTPHPGGCVLVRNFGDLRGSFDVFHLAYVHESADPSEKIDLGRIGPNFSRSFQSLKVWVSLLAHGRDAYARRISHDAELARYLGALAEEHPAFELCTPVGLSITVFRYVPPDLRDDDGRGAYLDALNARLVEAIQADGRVFVSNAELQDGTFALRSCVVNYRTEAEDMEAVLAVAEELGARLDLELRPEDLR